MGLNLSKFSIALLNFISNAVKVESKAYNWTWVFILGAIKITYLSNKPQL